MSKLRPAQSALEGVVPYDPKYLAADAMLSANESPWDVPGDVREAIADEIARVSLNRYPDPVASTLRQALAMSWGVDEQNVLIGNGGDELIFDLALAWGGPGRKLLDMPPTFGSYAAFAELVGTEVVTIPRRDDFTVDEQAVLDRVAQGDIDLVVLCSPNNPSGDCASRDFIERLLTATDALVLIDEAYGEFAECSVVDMLGEHENLAILRTFSKAYRLAGVRMGYLLASTTIISELMKVRQPYSVDALAQAAALAVWTRKDAFADGIATLIAERRRLQQTLSQIEGIEVFPSDANFIMVRMNNAGQVWQKLYERGVLVRDFSAGALTKNCLRLSVGTPAQNDALIEALTEIVKDLS